MKKARTLGLLLATLAWVGCGREGTVAKPSAALETVRTPSAAKSPPTQDPIKAEASAPFAHRELPPPTALTAEDWPQYRGQRRDGYSLSTGLMHDWPIGGPRLVWQTSVGPGYASPSVVAGRVYLQDYDESQGEWMVRCLSLEDGQEQWRYTVKKRIRPNHAITRAAPATDGGFVFAIDPKCELHCLDARNGDILWRKQLPAEYESPIPAWYNGQCPLIDNGRLVVATGGRALMTALEKATGKPIWETENSEQFLLSHSSITPVETQGVRQYTYNTLKGAVGVDADTGKLLWHFPWKFNTAVATTPLSLGDGKLLLTSGYHAQTVVCQARREGDAWSADEVVAAAPPTQGWNSEVHTPILYRDRIYGVGKKQRGLWTCLDLEANELWTSKGQASFGMGGYLLADGMFFVLEGKTGVLRVLDANADQYEELASCQLLEGPDVWAPPVISQGRLLIRDLGKLICLDIADTNAGVVRTAKSPRNPSAVPGGEK